MPELPEVETIRRYLAPLLTGQTILAVPHLDSRMVKGGHSDAETIRHQLIGRTISRVERRGKFLLLRCVPPGRLILHLGMSGRLTVEEITAPKRLHTHLVLRFVDWELRLVDPRRFGRIGWQNPGEAIPLPRLGPEPLSASFTARRLADRLKGRRAPIKALLLDQGVVAGLGNIYCDEALFGARIHPLSEGASLSLESVARLHRALKRALRSGIAHRGTSFSDYVDALGHPGENQEYLKVYGRTGKPCVRCGTKLASVVVRGRTSHYCPRCQTPPKTVGSEFPEETPMGLPRPTRRNEKGVRRRRQGPSAESDTSLVL